MNKPKLITGLTFKEMIDPSQIVPNVRQKALAKQNIDPLDSVNLFNISWKMHKTGFIMRYCRRN